VLVAWRGKPSSRRQFFFAEEDGRHRRDGTTLK
jgi:hypothetical protein